MSAASAVGRAAMSHLPSAAQARIISSALDLFARHGVGGTSLQMIADDIGVTKAAVYHQFKTKGEIIIAAAESELARLEKVIDAAEGEASPAKVRHTLVTGMIDLAVARRRTASTILNDPLIVGLLAGHEPTRLVMDRLCRVLMGGDIGYESRVSTAMFAAAISGAVMHPLVNGLDDETLRSQLQLLTQRLLPSIRG